MSALLVRSRDGASPRMLAVSAVLHGLLLLIVMICSAALQVQRPPTPEEVTRVVLTEQPEGPPAAEKIQPGPVKDPEPTLPEDSQQTEPLDPPPKLKREIVQAQELSKESPPAAVRLTKRKKPPKRVEAPKKEPAPPEKQEKKESPESFLENRLASLRKDVESRKSAPAARKPAPEAKAVPAQGSHGSASGNGTVDAEAARWLALVKTRINANWSLPANGRQVERVAIIGVQISDNGALANVAVDSSSGDEFFDKSAMRAVFQAAPFPSPPTEVARKIRDAGGLALRFTPRGMQ